MTNEPYTFLDPQDEKNLSLDTDRMKVGAFEAHLTPLSAADVKQLHELSVNVFWPHRDRDLALFLEVGSGYMARDQIGRPLGSAMYFPCGDDFAMIGMMMTAPRLQSRGTGRWLLHHVMRDCAARDLRLSATRSGYWLYESSGFLPVATIRRHQGIVRSVYRPDKIAGVTLRRGTLVDKAAIAALDRIGFGADRQTILDRLWEKSTSVVAKRAGSIVGYAFFRNFGRGTVIGPVVADSDEMAMHLTASLLADQEDTFVRIDTPVRDGKFTAFLSAVGLGMFDTVTEMRVGPHRRATDGSVIYGLAAQALG